MTERLVLLLISVFSACSAAAFVITNPNSNLISASINQKNQHQPLFACGNRRVVLFAASEEDDKQPAVKLSTTEKILENEKKGKNTSAASYDIKKLEEKRERKDYPIDLPSPILLAASMVLAISSTGK